MIVERIGPDVRIRPPASIDATVRLPGSKSIVNRCLVCAALAEGESTLHDATDADDVATMVRCLRQLGVDIRAADRMRTLEIAGRGPRIETDDAALDVGNAGTAMRFLAALAAAAHGRCTLDGAPRMRQRPIGELAAALQRLGAGVEFGEAEGFPPITIDARGLRGAQVRFESPQSSQFVSAVLMAAPTALGDVFIDIAGTVTSRPYVELTLDVMRRFGVEVLADDERRRLIVPAPQPYRPAAIRVEPDASAAGYLWAAAAVTGGRVRVLGLSRGSVQGDVRLAEVLEQMGCTCVWGADFVEMRGPAGRLLGVDVDLNALPDAVQTVGVAALFADGPTTIRNVSNLRVKETDRLAALGAELTRLGARVDVGDDGLRIDPPPRLAPAAIETYDDHRMAMSFAIAGLATEGIVIRGAECVAKSFPEFFDVLESLARDSARQFRT